MEVVIKRDYEQMSKVAAQIVDGFQAFFQTRALAHQGLGLGRVVPQVGVFG